MTETSKGSGKHGPLHRLRISITRLAFGAAVFLLILTFAPLALTPAEASGLLNRPLHSVNEADYRADLYGSLIPDVDISIVRDVLEDFFPGDPDLDLRVTAVYADLLTPVPTSTPLAGETLALPESQAAGTPLPSPDATGTQTPTQTPSQTPTASPTATSTLVPTRTYVYVWPTSTKTPKPALTKTATPAKTASPITTVTSIPTAAQTLTGNHPPVISAAANQTVEAGQPYSLTPTASDPDGDPLAFSITGKPAWAIFDPASGTLSGAPDNRHAGSTNITITVTDGRLDASISFKLTVTYTNHPPTISGPLGQTATAGSFYTFTPTASDPDGDPLTFSIAGQPAWASFDPASGALSGLPTNADTGSATLTITVTDGAGSAGLTFILTVTNTNHAPVISGDSNHTVAADSPYAFTPTASDPDGDLLAFTITGQPAWTSFDPSTGTLFGTPTNADVGTTTVTITAADGTGAASLTYTLTVTFTNHPPSISGPASQSVSAGTAYRFTPAASDPDGDPLTFSITGQPDWANFNPADGTLNGTPTNANTGEFEITITVSDGEFSASYVFTIVVTTTNHPPVINGAVTQFVEAGTAYVFTPLTNDPDKDPLSFSITGQPAWAVFDPATGTVSGTPTNADVGTVTITITVSDGQLTSDLTYDLTVKYPNNLIITSTGVGGDRLLAVGCPQRSHSLTLALMPSC